MFKIFMYIVIISCLFGQILVTKNKRSGYLIWVLADGFLAFFNFSQYKIAGAIEQGILWTLYFIISLWGYLRFKSNKNKLSILCQLNLHDFKKINEFRIGDIITEIYQCKRPCCGESKTYDYNPFNNRNGENELDDREGSNRC